MQWTDDAYVVACRSHGETGVILHALTRGYGRVVGYVPGGRSRRLRPVLQLGNRIQVTWRARLEENMGRFSIEGLEDRGLAFSSRDVIGSFQVAAAHVMTIPERQDARELYDSWSAFSNQANDRTSAINLLIAFERAVLAQGGFALDLSRCAAGGAFDDLAYVSPRTGRAVSRSLGEPWKDKLLPLPRFMVDNVIETDEGLLRQGAQVTGHFLHRTIYSLGSARSLPEERWALLEPRRS